MLGTRRLGRSLLLGVVLAAMLPFVLGVTPGAPAAAQAACSLDEKLDATTCRLLDGQTVEVRPVDSGSTSTYRLDVLTPDATVNLKLTGKGGSSKVALIDWRGGTLGEGVRGDDAPDVTVSTKLVLPGVYAVRVSGDRPPDSPPTQLTATVSAPGAAMKPWWPPALAGTDLPLVGERYTARTPRGGTPAGAVAVARALRAPPEGEVGDFTLVADVRFEQIQGPSAFTVRFRYEPEAGGGTGYVLSVDPFGGTATLDSFDEGQRKSIVAHVPLPVVPSPDVANRLMLRATGSSIEVTLDGQPVLEATDGRYPRGLIAIGSVTWSDPVAVTFDHVQVTVPAP
ncbi:MAG: hypothetical protein U0893_17620 [Chloroflexota bacterium]